MIAAMSARKSPSLMYWAALVGVWVVLGAIAFALFVAPYIFVALEFVFPH